MANIRKYSAMMTNDGKRAENVCLSSDCNAATNGPGKKRLLAPLWVEMEW